MIYNHALHVMAKRIHTGCSDNAGLSHGPSQSLLPLPGFRDKFLAARQGRSHRSSQAFAKINPGRVKISRKVLGRDLGRNHCVEQAGSIHMSQQMVSMGHLTDLSNRLERPYRSTSHIGSLLHRNQACAWLITSDGTNRLFDLLGAENVTLALQRLDHCPRQSSRTSCLGIKGMGCPVEQNFIPRPAVNFDRDLIAHGSRG